MKALVKIMFDDGRVICDRLLVHIEQRDESLIFCAIPGEGTIENSIEVYGMTIKTMRMNRAAGAV